jgi:hypothetical protein
MNECQRIVKANDTWGSLDDVESDGDIGCPRRDILAHPRCTWVRPLSVEVKTYNLL